MANEFYTLASLGTLAGATGCTVAVTNALKLAFNISPRWLGLLVAQVICIGALFFVGPAHASDWFIAVLNGFLVFVTAAGATAIGSAVTGAPKDASDRTGNVKRGPEAPSSASAKRFWSPWF